MNLNLFTFIVLCFILLLKAWIFENILKSENLGTATREQSLRIWIPSSLLSWIIIGSGVLADPAHNRNYYLFLVLLEFVYFLIFNFMLNREFKVNWVQSLKIYIMELLAIFILAILVALVFGASFNALTTL